MSSAAAKPGKPPDIHPSILENRGQPVPDDLKKAAKDRTSRVRTKMTFLVPFFGHLLLKLQPVMTRNVLLAAVSRDRHLLINPDWATTTSESEFAATLAHEVLHPAMLVWERQAGRDAIVVGGDGVPTLLWNLAHDYAINLIIRQMTSFILEIMDPADWKPAGLIDEKYENWSAEEIYDDLFKEAQKNARAQGMGGGRGYLPQSDETKADLQDGKGSPGSRKEDGKRRPMSASEKKANDQFWKVALVEAAQVHEMKTKNRGSLPASIRKIIDEILDPRVPWTDVLSRWVGENGRRADFTYRRPSRRSESVGEFLPSLQKHGVDDIVVLWDTSGSMYGREVEILSEVIGICEDLNMKLRVICCDAEVHSDQSGVESPEDVDVEGGGGSDFTPAFDLLDDEGYQGVVVAFTDGHIGVPPQKPIHLRDCLWVIWEGDADPTDGTWGEVLNVDEEGFVR